MWACPRGTQRYRDLVARDGDSWKWNFKKLLQWWVPGLRSRSRWNRTFLVERSRSRIFKFAGVGPFWWRGVGVGFWNLLELDFFHPTPQPWWVPIIFVSLFTLAIEIFYVILLVLYVCLFEIADFSLKLRPKPLPPKIWWPWREQN